MLHISLSDFLSYCKTNEYGSRTLEVFSSKFNEFRLHLNSLHSTSYREISYDHLLAFIISGNPSVHVKKQRVWFLRQFFQYLKNNSIVKVNIASKLPYPKINQKEPEFLTFIELKTIIDYFLSSANSPAGIRNLIIVLFLVFLGLRISSIININIQDIDLKTSSMLVTEKGDRKRIIFLPQILCFFLYPYIKALDTDLGPLFLSNRNKRVSTRSIQTTFSEASLVLGIHINSRIFRHTAATEVNRIAGLDVAKEVLGHRRRESTKRYVHLNPDVYAEYMGRHPYMNLNFKEKNND
jgi:integrase/recombinase XerC